MEMHSDSHYMRRCLELAEKGGGAVAPNPMVGAVLVYNGQIIGEGFHKKYGEAHAEVNCIADASKTNAHKISNSTLYVSLEPCAHFGKTPPCTQLILQKKIPRVVIGCRDSYEKVNGSGIERLQSAGVEVVVGIQEKESLELNKRFFCFHKKKRPYVVLKWAQTADGFLTANTQHRLLISNEITNRLVHKWRSGETAILAGANTLLKDDPLLDNRWWYGPPPIKIVMDPLLQLPQKLKIFKTGSKIFVLNQLVEKAEGAVQYLKVEGSEFLTASLRRLYEMNIMSLFVEGGRKTLQSFVERDVWDEAKVITNRKLFVFQGIEAPTLSFFRITGEEDVLTDRVQYFENMGETIT